MILAIDCCILIGVAELVFAVVGDPDIAACSTLFIIPEHKFCLVERNRLCVGKGFRFRVIGRILNIFIRHLISVFDLIGIGDDRKFCTVVAVSFGKLHTDARVGRPFAALEVLIERLIGTDMENVAAIVFDCFLIADRLVIRAGHGEFAAKSIAHGIVVCRLNERIEALVIHSE